MSVRYETILNPTLKEVIDIHIGVSLIYLSIAYLVATLIGVSHTILNWKSGKYPYAKDVGRPITQGPAYKATEPYHPLYNIVVFPIAAYVELHFESPSDMSWVWKTALLWTITSVTVDWLGWVVIPHPFRMTYREFYVDYQPWITVIYMIIFVSPFLADLLA